MKPSISGVFYQGDEDPSNSPFRAHGKSATYSLEEAIELLNQYSVSNPIHDLLNATKSFLAATSLKYQAKRNSNPDINTNYCHDYLQATGTALANAKTILGKDPLKQKELNEAIGYCVTAIQKRLDELGPNDKYTHAFQKDNALKAALGDGPRNMQKSRV